jgi:hypothetical protein
MKCAAKAAVRGGPTPGIRLPCRFGVDGCMARLAEVGAGRDPAEQTKTRWVLEYHALAPGTASQP